MRKLAPEALMAVDDHILACAACREAAGASFMTAAATERFVAALTKDGHCKYEELAAYVDGSLVVDEQLRVERHFAICDCCRDELRELETFAAPTSVEQNVGSSWLAAFFWRPVPIFSLIALLSIGSLIWIRTADNSSHPVDLASQKDETLPPAPEVSMAEAVPPDGNPTAAKTAVTINDGDGAIIISSTGELQGYPSVPFNYRQLVKSALVTGKLAVPNLGELRAEPGLLMGESSSIAGTFRLYSPVGQIVNTKTPRFSWQAVAKAEGYVVEIFDQNYNQVALSPHLKNAFWKQKLAPGRTYSWQVTAFADGKVFKAPLQPQPEARFRVLDQRTMNELLTLKRSHPLSHLLLGIAYANAGLTEDAIREIQLLSKQNPHSGLPRQFLRQLKGLK